MNRKKMIELFIYITIVVVSIILLITSNVKGDTKQYDMSKERSKTSAIVSTDNKNRYLIDEAAQGTDCTVKKLVGKYVLSSGIFAIILPYTFL